MKTITPQSEAELAETIATATAPLWIRGGGTRGLAPVTGCDLLETAGLRGVELYEPGALTLVARAGTPVSEIETLLAAENQRLAFEPMDHRAVLGTTGTPTIGGVFAANVSGPRRIQAGAARDFLLGVRFVDGRGDVLRNGGRVMKNVTGYDLVKLMAGAHGTLGVLSEVAFKVLPRAQCCTTLVLRGIDARGGIEALSAGLGSPFDVTGAACDPGAGEAYLRLEGFAQSVAYRAVQLRERLARQFGATVEVEIREESAPLWQGLRDLAPLVGKAGDLWRLSLRPSDAAEVLERIAPRAALLDWGGGLLWALGEPGQDLRAQMGVAGHATLVRGDGSCGIARHHPEPEALAAIAAGVRAQFDPRAILNPGLMG